MSPDFPKVFFEGTDVPTEAIGVESIREGRGRNPPPITRIHVWWARRPLTASRFAIVGSLVGDSWTSADVLEVCGVPRGKDPVKGQRLVDEVKQGIRKQRVVDPYGYPRAYSNSIPNAALSRFHSTCKQLWGTEHPVILDMFAGGGSIPFEGVRVGLQVNSVELNPVACVLQYATLSPLKAEPVSNLLEKIGYEIANRVGKKMTPFFPRKDGEDELCYIWVRSVLCEKCGFDAPLSPNWWLDTENSIGFRPTVKKGLDVPVYKIAKKGEDGFDPEDGSEAGGAGECIRCKQPIPKDYIKKQAQAGKMGHQLAAVGYKMKGQTGRRFRSATDQDLAAYEAAKKELKKMWPEWARNGLIPTEGIPEGLKTAEPRRMGALRWCDMFNPRQLLVHLTTLEELLNYDWKIVQNAEARKALRTCLGLALDKTLNYNAIQSRLHTSRVIIASVFDRHDFAFIWSYGEIDGAGSLFRFGVDEIVLCIEGLAELLSGVGGEVNLRRADARDLSWLSGESVHAVVTDPPYEANVMYAELSDFFYVWLKRSVGDLFTEWFSAELTDKDGEAVANSARFKSVATKRGGAIDAALQDYRLKMTQAWKEAYRVLKPGGVITVMFNHTQMDAWDALARSLIQAGFTITASWAVTMQNVNSLNIREKQAVTRTILLTGRKVPRDKGAWWEDVRKEVRLEVRKKLEKVIKAGPYTSRIDLLMSAYGEGLRVVSGRWPVKDSQGNEIPVKDALAEARMALQEWYFEAKLGRSPAFDTLTKVVLYAMEGYGSREAEFDDVHKYGLALGVSVDDLLHGGVADRRKAKVVFLDPAERSKRTNRINPDREEFVSVWDRVQAASLQFGEMDAEAFKRWLRTKGFMADSGFLDACRFLAVEGPSEFIEVKMARAVVGSGQAAPPSGQTKLAAG